MDFGSSRFFGKRKENCENLITSILCFLSGMRGPGCDWWQATGSSGICNSDGSKNYLNTITEYEHLITGPALIKYL